MKQTDTIHPMEKVYSIAIVWKCQRGMSLGKDECLLLWAICAFVHLIEFVTFQASCQMGSLPSGKRGNVFCLLVLTNFRDRKRLTFALWKPCIQVQHQTNKQTKSNSQHT